MSSLNILSGGAAQGLVGSLAPTFKVLTGFDITGEFGAVGAMADKLRNGVATDIVILTAAIVAKLATEKLVVPSSIADVGLVETALAVRAGEPQVTANDAATLRAGIARRRCDLRSGYQGINGRHSCCESAAPAGHCRAGFGPAQDLSEWRDRHAPACGIRRHEANRLHPVDRDHQHRQAWCCRDLCRAGCDLSTVYTAAVTTGAVHARQARDLIGLLIAADQHELRQRAGFLNAGK